MKATHTAITLCSGCSAKLTYEPSDVILDDTGHTHPESVKCPDCGTRQKVEVPAMWTRLLYPAHS